MLGSSRTIESENHEEEKDFPQEKIFYTKSQNMQEKVYFCSKLILLFNEYLLGVFCKPGALLSHVGTVVNRIQFLM